jgi:hypothetical protein
MPLARGDAARLLEVDVTLVDCRRIGASDL